MKCCAVKLCAYALNAPLGIGSWPSLSLRRLTEGLTATQALEGGFQTAADLNGSHGLKLRPTSSYLRDIAPTAPQGQIYI
jgi:hypothetical protein